MIPLFVTCASSLEPILAEELQEMGYSQIRPGFRGVNVEAPSLEDVYRINYSSRIAERVLLPLRRFGCRDKNHLYREAGKINWTDYLSEKQTFAIDANVQHSAFRNSLYAAQVVKDAICDQFREKKGIRPNVDTFNPDVQINLYMQPGSAVLSLDTSGQALHKRGYRIEGGEAPMRETLAAAALKLAQFTGDEIFCDPCCGSGTLLIEAALIATHTAPGFLRQRWGFMALPEFSQVEWLKVKNRCDAEKKPLEKGRFLGIDRSREAVRICKANLRAAGLHTVVEVIQDDFREFTPSTPPTFVVANPPYGKRIEELESLKSLYRSLGEFMKQKMAKPSRGFVFTGSLDLAKEIGLAAKRRHILDNGGMESRLLEFEIY